MTRINCGIPPADLNDRHLMAEHREIKRIPNTIRKGKFKLDGQPSEFTLGKGHVKFFYTRLKYLKRRYESIYQECLSRGFNVTYYGNSWQDVPVKFMNDYTPTKRDIEIIKERINGKQKIKNKDYRL